MVLVAKVGINNNIGCPSIEKSFRLSVTHPPSVQVRLSEIFVVFEWGDDGHTDTVQAISNTEFSRIRAGGVTCALW